MTIKLDYDDIWKKYGKVNWVEINQIRKDGEKDFRDQSW